MLTKPLSALSKIGNSGYAEYYFFDAIKQKKISFDSNHPEGYFFNDQVEISDGYNYLILPPDVNDKELELVIVTNNHSSTIKNKVEHFNSGADLANFREVDGGSLASCWLFRSYHPVKLSRSDSVLLSDIEKIRLDAVQCELKNNHINTIINLSETEQELAQFLSEKPHSFYKDLWYKQQIQHIPMSYETVYFMSHCNQAFNANELGFEDGICKLFSVIADNQGPYHVHCRLGSDRTGVAIAFLQLFMGASREVIKQNYLQTNQLGIGEYRSFSLLAYSLQQALGMQCFSDSHNKVTNYLIKLGLDKNTIEKAYSNLGE